MAAAKACSASILSCSSLMAASLAASASSYSLRALASARLACSVARAVALAQFSFMAGSMRGVDSLKAYAVENSFSFLLSWKIILD